MLKADGLDKAFIRQAVLAIAAPTTAAAALSSSEYSAFRFGSDYLNVEGITNWKANLDTTANHYNGTVTTSNGNALEGLHNRNITIVPYIDDYLYYDSANFKSLAKKLFCLDSVINANSFTASASFSGFSGGTNNPVSFSVINSGTPPTFDPTTGTFR